MENLGLENMALETLYSLKQSVQDRIEVLLKADKKLCDDIKLEVKEDKVYTTSYYCSKFVTKARNLKGTWSSGKWVFDIAILEHVKKAMLDCYGVTGEEPYEVVVLEVRNYSEDARTSGVELFGRPIAKASGRDSGARLEAGVVFIEGRATSSGSVKNWSTYVKDATFEIHKFAKARTGFTDVQNAIAEGWVSIK